MRFAMMLVLTLAGCAPTGYHYKGSPGSLESFTTLEPDDPCWDIPGGLGALNSAVNHPSKRVIAITQANVSYGARDEDEFRGRLQCHINLTLEDGSTASGYVSFTDPKDGQPLMAHWLSDTDIAAKEKQQRETNVLMEQRAAEAYAGALPLTPLDRSTKVVHCTIGWSSTWTTAHACSAMIRASQAINRHDSQDQQLSECTMQLARDGASSSYPGDNLNMCTSIIEALTGKRVW